MQGRDGGLNKCSTAIFVLLPSLLIVTGAAYLSSCSVLRFIGSGHILVEM